jgi:hypothetical protein
MNPASCLLGSRFVYNPFFLLAVLLYFGLDCGLLFFFKILLTGRNPKNICLLSCIFGARFGGKDCGLCPIRDPNKEDDKRNFVYEAAQNLEIFTNIQN